MGSNGDMVSFVSEDHGTSELTLIEFEEEASSEPGTHNRYISASYQTLMSRLKLVVLARHRKWCPQDRCLSVICLATTRGCGLVGAGDHL